jgi:hypothetical protein
MMKTTGKQKTTSASVRRAQVTLMHPNAQVLIPGRRDPEPDLGPSRGPVLRLLALASGSYFSVSELSTIFKMAKGSVYPMVKDLRNRLGGPSWGKFAIDNKTGTGYGLLPDLVEVDAIRFQGMLRGLAIMTREIRDPDDLSVKEATAGCTSLEAALGMWRGNPARGLEEVEDDVHRYYTVYETLHQDALRLRTLCELRIGSPGKLRDAILRLEDEVEARNREGRTNPDVEPWRLLIRAYFSLGKHDKVQQIFAAARVYYTQTLRQSVPSAIESSYKRAQSNDRTFDLYSESDLVRRPIRLEKPTSAQHGAVRAVTEPTVDQLADIIRELRPLVPEDQQPLISLLLELIGIMSKIGISTASVLKLQGSKVEPKHCIRRVSKTLWFTGVLASKWVQTPAIRSELDDQLTILDEVEGGDVRFMILNPEGPVYKRLHDLRNGRLSAEHLPHLAALAKRHPCFRVRLFDHLPTFRILVIDRDFVTFSFYRLDETSYIESDGGLESPHIALDPLAPWPLASAFAGLFEESWAAAIDLEVERYRT